MIEDAGEGGRVVGSKFLRCSKSNPLARRNSGWLGGCGGSKAE